MVALLCLFLILHLINTDIHPSILPLVLSFGKLFIGTFSPRPTPSINPCNILWPIPRAMSVTTESREGTIVSQYLNASHLNRRVETRLSVPYGFCRTTQTQPL